MLKPKSTHESYMAHFYGFRRSIFDFKPLGNEWIVCRINRQLRILDKLNEDFELPNSLSMASFQTRHSFRLFWTNNIYLNIEQIKQNVLLFRLIRMWMIFFIGRSFIFNIKNVKDNKYTLRITEHLF